MTALHWMRRGLAGAALAVALAGCASAPAEWRADIVQLVTAPTTTRRAPCPAVAPAMAAEARRVTPIADLSEGEALTAALISSEVVKNASLARLMRAYETCRRGVGR